MLVVLAIAFASLKIFILASSQGRFGIEYLSNFP